ncbi:hypothetical protein M8J77_025885 [Diaphorina citri]|nr:hypothetical protein M8J77_025885 [Diaphorina citri]
MYYAKKCGKKTGKTDYFYCQKDGSSKAHCKTGEAPRKTSRKISIGSVKKDNICISSVTVEHQDSGIHRGHGENARRLDQKSIGYLLRAFTKRSKSCFSIEHCPGRENELADVLSRYPDSPDIEHPRTTVLSLRTNHREPSHRRQTVLDFGASANVFAPSNYGKRNYGKRKEFVKFVENGDESDRERISTH